MTVGKLYGRDSGIISVHDACGDVVGDLEGIDFPQALVELLVERLPAPADRKKKYQAYKQPRVVRSRKSSMGA